MPPPLRVCVRDWTRQPCGRSVLYVLRNFQVIHYIAVVGAR